FWQSSGGAIEMSRPPSARPSSQGREFPEMKMCALTLPNRGKTSNVQHRTPNIEVSEDARCHSMFGVGCSMLDVPPGSWKWETSHSPLEFHSSRVQSPAF